MILEGLKLVIIGMGIVFIFLSILMLSMIVTAKLLRQDIEVQKDALNIGALEAKSTEGSLIPILSAAIAAFRARRKK